MSLSSLRVSVPAHRIVSVCGISLSPVNNAVCLTVIQQSFIKHVFTEHLFT